MRPWTQKSALIQPKTSLGKAFAAGSAPVCRPDARGLAANQLTKQGCLMICALTRRGGGVILQTASQHAFCSAKICKFSQKISNISPRFCKIQRILTIICVLPQFRQNSMKIAAKMTDLNENSAKFCKINIKKSNIAKINGAKDCKFEFRAVQRNANLVDLENPCKTRLFSLS